MNLFSIVSATLDTTQAGGENTKTFVNTSIAPDKWTANGTSEWYNFTVTLSSGNATEVVITVPSSAVTTTANFSVANVTNAPYTNASGIWTITYPANYSANGLPRMINFSVAPASAFNQSARFDIYATANISDVADSLVNMWNITVRDNETLTYNMTYLNVTADTRSPVFNTTTPGNNSYISGNASQLFQVYAYDQYLNTNNVSLHWKLSTSGGGANWTTGTNIPCYAQASPLFICNTTIDNLFSDLGPGSYYFYFQGSDNATNYGNNGTATVPLTTTIDRSAPTNTSTSREKVASGSKYDTTDAANYFGFETVWTDATSGVSQVLFESNFTGAGTVKANTTAIKSGSTYTVNFSQHNFKQAGTYAYRWYANDSVAPTTDANWAVTSSFTYTIAQADNPATLYLNDTANANVGDLRYPAKVNATGVVTAGEMFLYRNRSGVWTDVSVAENKTNMTLPVGTHAYTVNTSGNANYTANNSAPSYYAVVGKGIVTLDLRLNTTTQANYSIVYPASVNATGNKSATVGSEYNISLYRDGAIVSTSLIANKAEESIQLANGTYNYTVVFNGSVNYTDASVTAERFVSVTKGPTTLALLLNGTAANMTVASGEYVNATVTVNHTTEGNTTHNITLYRNGVLYNSSISLTAIENMSAYANVPATVFTITGSYPEAQNYSAASGTYYVIIESTAPTYADNYTNVTASVWGKYQGVIGVNAAWDDGYNVSRTWLRSNETGTWALTNGSFTGAPKNVSNFTINPSSVDVSSGNAVVFGSIYANDTSNNINSTLNYTWTIDGVTPVLSSASPANQSYVYSNSSYPFRMAVNDYTLNVSNATVRWKKSTAGSWSSGSMTCSGAVPTFTCLKSNVDLSGYGEGDILYYYFQASDNSSLLGSIGSASNPYVVTLDSSAPTYSNNGTNRTVIGKYDAVKIFSNWTDADMLDTFLVEFTVGGDKWNVTEAKFISLGAGNTWSNYSYPGNSTGNWVPGTSIGWRIFANDSVPNWNVTVMVNFTVDNSVPTYSNVDQNVTNASTVAKGAVVQVNAQWNDNLNLSNYWLSNYSSTAGVWTNLTKYSFSADTYANWTNISFITWDTAVGAGILLKIYANDTAGNENVTTVWNYTIDGAVPTYSANGSNVTSGQTIPKGTPVLVYANWAENVQLSRGWIEHNETTATNTSITFAGDGNSTNYTISTSTAAAGTAFAARLFANDTSGNVNSTNWMTWIIDGTQPNPANVSLNGANGNGTSGYAPGKTYIFNVSWTDNLGDGNVSKVLLNLSYSATNYTADVLGSSNYSVSVSDMPTGNYWYKWFANDTSGNWNSTTAYSFNVTQNTTNPINLYMNGTLATNLTVIYPAQVNATAVSAYSNSGTIILERNGTAVTNMANTKLGNATYNYTAYTAGTANYTSNSTTLYAFVTKGGVSINLALNGTESNVTYTYPVGVNATGWISAPDSSEYNLSLWRDGAIASSTTSATSRSEVRAPIASTGGYNYTLTFTSTNYTDASILLDRFAIVNKGVSNVSLWLGNTTIAEANATVVQGQTLNITAAINTTYSVLLKMNTTIANGWVNQSTTGTRLENTSNTLGYTVANDYNVTVSFDGDANYSADSQTWWLNVTADVTGPATRIVDASLGYNFNNATARKSGATFSLNVSVVDAGIGITTGTTCIAKIGSAAQQTLATYSSGWCNGTMTVPSFSDGPAVLNITVNDTNNNTGFNSTYYVTIDSTPPIVAVTSPAANNTYVKSSAGGYIWINGTVSDNLQMGTLNVSVNGTEFSVFSFTGANATAFAIRNGSALADGYHVVNVNYTDNATSIGNLSVTLYVDNTPPSAAYGLTNSSNGTYQTASSQTVQVKVVDGVQTNATATLNYYINGSWFTAQMTGTPGTSTTYTATINTVANSSGYKLYQGKEYVPYYVTGVDNATNSIASSVGGTSDMPFLANITINQYCGNNGNALSYCSYMNWPEMTTGAVNNFYEVHLKTASTWGNALSDYNISTVLNSISGKYSYVYYKNETSDSWMAYDPSIAWGLNSMRFGNNTFDVYYVNATSMGAVIRV